MIKRYMFSKKLSPILSLEESSEILNFKFANTDFLMWPLIRFSVLTTLYYRGTGVQPLAAPNWPKIRLVSYALRILKENPLLRSEPFDFIFFNSGNTSIKKNEKFYDRLTDYFAGMFLNSSLLIEDSFRFDFKRPRSFPNVAAHDSLLIFPWTLSKILPPSRDNSLNIARFLDFLRSNVSSNLSENEYDILRSILTSYSIRLPFLMQTYRRLFRKLKPKIIFVQAGSYGQRSFILKVAHELSIITAELQHGYISDDHPAYNYGNSITTSALYKEYLPNHFLGYGNFWLNSINLPAEKWSIGNPHLTASMSELLKAGPVYKKNSILILSTGTNIEAVKNIASEVLASDFFRFYDIVFRPHPLERPNVPTTYAKILQDARVTLDVCDNIYSSLANATVVISELSTAIFEAVGFCSNVFVINDVHAANHVPPNLGIFIDSVDEIIKHLQCESSLDKAKSMPEDIWAPNWEKNFLNFIQHVCEPHKNIG